MFLLNEWGMIQMSRMSVRFSQKCDKRSQGKFYQNQEENNRVRGAIITLSFLRYRQQLPRRVFSCVIQSKAQSLVNAG